MSLLLHNDDALRQYRHTCGGGAQLNRICTLREILDYVVGSRQALKTSSFTPEFPYQQSSKSFPMHMKSFYVMVINESAIFVQFTFVICDDDYDFYSLHEFERLTFRILFN